MERLLDAYKRILQEVDAQSFNLNEDKYSGVFLPVPFEEYWHSPVKIMLVGRETAGLKWSTKTGHRVRVFSSIDFPIRLVVTHHYIRAVLVRCNIQRYSPLLRELHR
ncbi:Uncharacterised protein [Escherichia coli]|nr:Uncharacterised protein [Escherichia coli]